MILYEWHSAKFENPDKRDDFIKYLTAIWETRPRVVDEDLSEEEQQERKINKQRFFDFTIDGKISARNFVGLVQYEDIRISVFPKIFSDNTHPNDTDLQHYQLNLLFWLSYARKFKFPFSTASLTTTSFDNLLELMIYIFADYTEKILSQQPFQAYHNVVEETTFLKGRVLFDKYLQNNISTGRWQHFFCEHSPFIYDNQFNRIVKYVARKLADISNHAINRELLNSILFVLDEVTDTLCTHHDCDKVHLNPLYAELQQVLDLCKMFLSNEIIDIHSAESNNFCFLLPMEYIFEEFIYGFLSAEYSSAGIMSQSRGYLARKNNENAFQIKNDIYVKDKIIIDTKYKMRAKEDILKGGVSQTDMYQMVSYAIRRNCSNVLLLYPFSNKANNSSCSFIVSSENLNKDITIDVASVDISFDNINTAKGKLLNELEKIAPIFRTLS